MHDLDQGFHLMNCGDNRHLRPQTAATLKDAWLAGDTCVYPNGNPNDDGEWHSLKDILESGLWPLYVDFSDALPEESPDKEEQPWFEPAIDDPLKDFPWAGVCACIWYEELLPDCYARWFEQRRMHRDSQFVQLHSHVKRHRGRFGGDQHKLPEDAFLAARRAHLARIAGAEIREALLAADLGRQQR